MYIVVRSSLKPVQPPLRRLTWDLSLTSRQKDGVVNSRNKLQEAVCDCFKATAMTAAHQVTAGYRTSDLLI